VKRVKSPGWRIVSGGYGLKISGTLEQLLNVTHHRHANGEAPGLIEEVEITVELDMIQIQKLWRYLGLPT
jgi:hypothetical protein